MESGFNMAAMMCSMSVIALYVETILQTYVTVSAENASISSTPFTIISLCSIGVSFLSTSIASVTLPPPSSDTLDNCNSNDTLKQKVIFRCLHLFQFGLFWRIFRLIWSFSGSDVKLLCDLRLVHVAVQSLPYVAMYSTIFLLRGDINAIQALSLVLSVMSSALAVTCYNLRLKLCLDGKEEEETGVLQNSAGSFKTLCAILTTFLGTFLVLLARSVSITLVAAQVRLWVLIPLSFHFILILTVFCVFSTRVKGVGKSRIYTFIKRSFYCVGMSLLNSFDLVYDNIAQVMCKYVAFYSLFLIENIIFISFWLLEFDLNYVSKLVTVVVILSAFLIGLIIKFAGGNLLQRDMAKSQSEEALSQVTQGLPSIATTTTSATLDLRATISKEDDLVSIVQASLALTNRAHQPGQNSERIPTAQTIHLGAPSKSNRKKSKRAKSKTLGKKGAASSIEVQGRLREGVATNHVQTAELMASNRSAAAQSASDQTDRRHLTDASNQDDSFQQSSIFSVSDPETLLSDMMYDNVGAEMVQIRSNSLENTHQKCYQGNGHKSKELAVHRDFHAIGPFANIAQPISSQDENFLPDKRRHNTMKVNTGTPRKHAIEHATIPKRHLKNNPSNGFTPHQESSDTAQSSAKTYPCEPKKGAQTQQDSGSRFDYQMKNILSSMRDGTVHESTSRVPFRFSDSEAVARNKAGRLHSVNKHDRTVCKNIITYTEPDDGIPIAINGDPKAVQGDGGRRSLSFQQKRQRMAKEKSHNQFHGKPNDNATHLRIPSLNPAHLCESGSASSFTNTMTNNGMLSQTRSRSSSSASASSSSFTNTMTTEDCWRQEDTGQSSDAKSDKLSQFLLQSDTSRMSPSENIRRWLSTTSQNLQNLQNLPP